MAFQRERFMDSPQIQAGRLRAALASLKVVHAGRRFAALAAKANFNPGRVPPGNSDGGR